MQIKLITTEVIREDWNSVAKHPLQSYEWGEIKEQNSNLILRVAVFDDNQKLIEVYLITLHKLFGKFKMAFLAKSVWPSSEILIFLEKKLKELNCIFLKLEPEVFLEEAGKYQIPLLKNNWTKDGLQFSISNSRVFARHTFLIDLSFSSDELFELMKSKTRYNIHLAQKKGVVVKDETDNPEGFSIFFNLYQETLKRQNYLGHDKKYHELVWNSLKAKVARILVAYYDGKPLGAYELFLFNNSGFYLYGGSTLMNKEVMAPNLLMWEAILFAKKNNCLYFDMWGALDKNYQNNNSWAGFHRFKEGYGGIHKTYLPTIDVIFEPLLYKLFSFIWPIRTILLELKQKFF